MRLMGVTPIFRIFDEAKAKEFYLDYLGFHLDWEHRFHEGAPLYVQISKDSFVLHLSEHYGDCTPGASIRIAMEGLEEFHQSLTEQNYKFSRPGIERTEWAKELRVTDPFGNRLVFYEHIDGV